MATYGTCDPQTLDFGSTHSASYQSHDPPREINDNDATFHTADPDDVYQDLVEEPTNQRSSFMRSSFKRIREGGSPAIPLAINLAQAAVGAGTLGMPYVFISSGYVVALFLLLITGLVSVASGVLIVKVSDKLGCDTFEDVALTLGGKKFRLLVSGTLTLMTAGVQVVYVIASTACMKALLTGIPYWGETNGLRLVTFFLWLGIMLPLSMAKRIGILRYVSVVGVLFMFLIIAALVLEAHEHPQQISMAVNQFSLLTSLPNIFFSFCVHPNLFHIYRELRDRSPARMAGVIGMALVLAGALYTVAGLAGAFAFGAGTKPLVLNNFSNLRQEPFQMVAVIGYAFTVCISYRWVVFPGRDAIIQICFGCDNLEKFPDWKRQLVVFFYATTTLLIGVFVGNFGVTMDVIGGLGCGAVVFFFPAVFALQANLFYSTFGRGCMWALAIGGAIVGIGSAVIGVYHTVAQ